eukprot:TRINITY_DN2048_c0_g1_i3.p1 TRINITY_DN2048_c0_g1~~TRINITY_DN2048_c0_g1_i3.p1  ORF type:complete len:117 (+),score=10.60 TRINITY_DN2048_c0_g1_i3:43-393(+)
MEFWENSFWCDYKEQNLSSESLPASVITSLLCSYAYNMVQWNVPILSIETLTKKICRVQKLDQDQESTLLEIVSSFKAVSSSSTTSTTSTSTSSTPSPSVSTSTPTSSTPTPRTLR